MVLPKLPKIGIPGQNSITPLEIALLNGNTIIMEKLEKRIKETGEALPNKFNSTQGILRKFSGENLKIFWQIITRFFRSNSSGDGKW